MIIGLDASRAVAGQRTGTEGYAFHFIQALIPAAAARGHALRLYFNQPPVAGLFPEADHVERVSLPQQRLWTHVRLRRELNDRPPDVFFTPAHVIPFGYDRPSVATIHDLGYELFPEAHPRRQLAYLRWSTRHNARVARRVIADSQATAADLTRLYGVSPQKIDVVYPGADPDLRREGDQSVIAAAGARYGVAAPYLLYLGTLQPRKNLVRLIEAFRESGLWTGDTTLVLAGKPGWLAQSILDAIAELPPEVSGHVCVTGYVAEPDKAALLSGATALVFPSLYEGFGFPVLEAQACDVPVVCSNTSSLPEAAGQGALLVNPHDTAALADALRRVVVDDVLRARLISDGTANVGRFSWETAARQVLNALEAVVA